MIRSSVSDDIRIVLVPDVVYRRRRVSDIEGRQRSGNQFVDGAGVDFASLWWPINLLTSDSGTSIHP